MSACGIRLFAVALLFAGPRLDAMCSGPVTTRLIQVRVDACRVPEREIRAAMEPYRARDLDRGVEHRLASGDVVATLKVIRFRQLSPVREGEERTAGPWQEPKEAQPTEFLVRMGAGGCDALALGSEQLFLDDWPCCDVRPSSDNACLLHLNAFKPAPEEVVAKLGS